MNEVKLTGSFKQVSAYTDCIKELSDVVIWKTDFDDGAETQFYTDNNAWIKVHVDKNLYDFIKEKELEHSHIQINGILNTRIGRGTGVVENFIEIVSIEY